MHIDTLYEKFIDSDYQISTDTRQLIPGSIFFALKGENFNGNDFAQQALDFGCSHVVIDDISFKIKDPRCVIVENSIQTLQELAHHHRLQFNIPVVGLTGSNGKTTTKELITSVLQTQKKIIATKGNLNNHIGVPLTLLRIRPETEVAIIEMGANHIGEIADLCKIALPTHGVITNIGRAHLGLFGGYAGVVKAKTELYDFIRTHGGEVFVNASDDLLREKSNSLKRVMYGPKFLADPVTSNKTLPYVSVNWKEQDIQTHLTGEYNLDNIAAAISIAVYFELQQDNIIKGLETYIPKNQRSEILETEKGNILIKDYYNANPDSMEKALQNLKEINVDKKKIAILGDMFELGEFASAEHRSVMHLAVDSGIDEILLIGLEFGHLIHEYTNISLFEKLEDALVYIKNKEYVDSIILLKASQGMNFKKIFDQIDW